MTLLTTLASTPNVAVLAMVVLLLNLELSLATPNTYYVDSIRGDDSRVGTSAAQSWRSIDRVNREPLGPGDSVLLAADSVFEGALVPVGQGTQDQPITIGMYGAGAIPRIDGHGRVEAVVHLRNTQHITLQDLHLTNYGAERGPNRRGVLIELDNFGTAHRITIRRLKIQNINGSLVKDTGGSAIFVRNGGAQVKSRFDGLLIEDNLISRAERNGITGSSDYCGREDWYPNLKVVIRRNLLEEIPGDGIVPIGCDGALVESNVVRNGTPLLRKEHSAAAGIWPWSCDNTIIQYNEVSRHRAMQDGQGFDADWNCRGTIIQFNYSHHNDGGFLLICNDGNSDRSWNAGNVGTIIRHNVSFNDGLRHVTKQTPPSERAPAININGPCADIKIYGNLIIAPRKTSADADNKLILATEWKGYPSDVLIHNNFFLAEGEAAFDVSRGTRFVFRNNSYLGPIDNPNEDSKKPLTQLPTDPFAFPGPGVKEAIELLRKVSSEH